VGSLSLYIHTYAYIHTYICIHIYVYICIYIYTGVAATQGGVGGALLVGVLFGGGEKPRSAGGG